MEDAYIEFKESADESIPSTATISGAVTILTVNQLKKELLTAFEQSKKLTIDLSGITELDLAGMQLLCSVHRSAIALKISFTVAGYNQLVWQMAETSGHLRLKGCEPDINNTCMWIKGSNQP